ncbi:OB-fold domain-containing protein [Mesorhizobium sp. M0500]|uniref:Zn-ribbon domain-containing OB-fold protein n=1 Tax=Mesorhizobium sp. M0500 TaxID=2956953 RepID=UPI00333C9C9D
MVNDTTNAKATKTERNSAPVPMPDQTDRLSAPFWKAANGRRLAIQRCDECKEFHHPPVGLCPHCRSDKLSFTEVSGRGKVYSWAIVRGARIAAFEDKVPYIVASIELNDAPGVFLLSNMPGTVAEEMRHDMPVTVVFDEIAEGIFIPQFESAEA